MGKLYFSLRNLALGFLLVCSVPAVAQHSVAMQWNETQLNCIRKDAARPTVQARNLFHASIVMYDAWAAFDDDAATVMLGKNFNGHFTEFNGIAQPVDRLQAQEIAISYAMYRFIDNRYRQYAPTAIGNTQNNWVLFMQGYCNNLMNSLGLDPSVTSTDYSDGDPAKLGNYIAAQMQIYGLQDGANQGSNYSNQYYVTVNGPIQPVNAGNPEQYDGNRWQPLLLPVALDQNGFPVYGAANALSPEWGNVKPFSLTEDQLTVRQRDGHDWNIYLDPGPPPYLDTTVQSGFDDSFFKWGYSVVSIWHSLHDPADGVMQDVSPATIGNLDPNSLPTTFDEYKNFYNVFGGGDYAPGYDVNPATGQPYEPQIVPRADYTRTLAEYWADGPSSETPPGHWFTILNTVMNHPLFEKRWAGQGPILEDLEYDVRAYFALGGGIHDAAIACWGAKGYYDFTRPIMAIRYMADHGQSADPNLPNYHPAGLPIVPGYIEQVAEGDPLAGENNEHVGKMKLYTYRGPVAQTQLDGVGWILAENWWTFQRKTFVTPPFAGYYSGHSTYSRTGAEILTLITGNEYFPGGFGEFFAPAFGFLTASPGPSVDVELEWARYRDAADQCSLSRIFGGLHPPCDDIPGRRVGAVIGPMAYTKANAIMQAGVPRVVSSTPSAVVVNDALAGTTFTINFAFNEIMDQTSVPTVSFTANAPTNTLAFTGGTWLNDHTWQAQFSVTDNNQTTNGIRFRLTGALDLDNNSNLAYAGQGFSVDTQNPVITEAVPSASLINDDAVNAGSFAVDITLDEAPATSSPVFNFNTELGNTLELNTAASFWVNDTIYHAEFVLSDENITSNVVSVTIAGMEDESGNAANAAALNNLFVVDTENPTALEAIINTTSLTDVSVGTGLVVDVTFNEPMDITSVPVLDFPNNNTSAAGLSELTGEGTWLNPYTFEFLLNLTDANAEESNIDVRVIEARDAQNNNMVNYELADVFSIDTQNPNGVALSSSAAVINDAISGNTVQFIATFDDEMNTNIAPTIAFDPADPLAASLQVANTSAWIDAYNYRFDFTAADANEDLGMLNAMVVTAQDDAGNNLSENFSQADFIFIDTRNPEATSVTPLAQEISWAQVGQDFTITADFDEAMETSIAPSIDFTADDPSATLTLNGSSAWVDNNTYVFHFNVAASSQVLTNIDFEISGARDSHQNLMATRIVDNGFTLDMINAISEVSLDKVNIYPNPAGKNEVVTINAPTSMSAWNIQVFDIAGKLVWSKPSGQFASNLIQLPSQNWNSGSYVVSILHNGVQKTLRFNIAQ
jgi:hypothetical protein